MNFRKNLLAAITGWNADPISDEWLFEKFRDSSIGAMSSSEAFDAINETIDMLLRESDESTATEIVQTFISLALQSGTTEIPKLLLINKSEIQIKFACFGDYANNKLQELFRYYRI